MLIYEKEMTSTAVGVLERTKMKALRRIASIESFAFRNASEWEFKRSDTKDTGNVTAPGITTFTSVIVSDVSNVMHICITS